MIHGGKKEKEIRLMTGDIHQNPAQQRNLKNQSTVILEVSEQQSIQFLGIRDKKSESRTKLHPYSNSKLEMADVHIPDDIIINILGRLPAKPLLRSRCVSKHWCRLISDPCFMNSRSRKKILFRGPPLYALDDNHNSMAKLPYPFENQSGRHVTMIGTFKGIVVLVVIDRPMGYAKKSSHILLYNPFTRVSKIVHDPYSPFNDIHLYGFAYGDDDLKIVRLRDSNLSDNIPNRSWKTCDVLNLKTSLWSSSEILIKDAQLLDDVGTYAKGFLYWNAFEKIVALNVKEMVISEIYLTNPRYDAGCRLGTLYGRLCIINNDNDTRCDVWIMKEENSWSKACSFTFGQDLGYPGYGYGYRLLNIMDDGRVVMTDEGYHVIIYDTSKHSSRILNFNSPKFRIDDRARGMEYMETLISPNSAL